MDDHIQPSISSRKTLMTGAAYIRVSTGKQEELSPDSQKRLILEYALSHQICVPEDLVFMENGISGRKADRRPQFQEMIARAKAGQFQIILLWKFSRFARNQEESIVYKSMLRKIGVDVVSISEPLADGPFGSLIERIIEWMDEFYSIRLSGDVTRGMTEKAMRGGFQSRPPLGYQIPHHNALPVIVPEEACIIKTIFDSFVNECQSPYQIALRLNEMGLLTRSGRPFGKRSVTYILTNPFYAGLVRWNRTQASSGSVRDESQWIIREGPHAPIVSRDLFDKTQELLRRRPGQKGQHNPHACGHWLSGILKCSCCGRTLVASHKKSKGGQIYYSFRCHGYGKGQCPHSQSVSEKKLSSAILAALEETSGRGDTDYLFSFPPSPMPVHRELITEQLIKLNGKEQRIRDAYANGIDDLEDYRKNRALITSQKNRLQQELAQLEQSTEVPPFPGSMPPRSICDLLASPLPASDKNLALKSVVEKIVFDGEAMQIHLFFRDLLT